jgi:hypothetical protein
VGPAKKVSSGHGQPHLFPYVLDEADVVTQQSPRTEKESLYMSDLAELPHKTTR